MYDTVSSPVVFSFQILGGNASTGPNKWAAHAISRSASVSRDPQLILDAAGVADACSSAAVPPQAARTGPGDGGSAAVFCQNGRIICSGSAVKLS